MGYKEFKAEVQRLVEIKGAPKDLTEETSLEGLDSLASTEICVAAEEQLDLELSYEEVRKLKTYGELQDLLSEKGFGP